MKKLLVLSSLLLFAANASFAQYAGFDAGTLNREYVRDLRTHEAITRARSNSAIVTPKAGTQMPKELSASDIKAISFVGNESISSAVLNNLLKDKINQPMSAENIAAIRKTVMRFYQEQGFFSAVAMVLSQDSQTGELVIEVREGGKNSIQIQN